eukprot:TRINITY_DN19937_c1_g1_i4.p1 TRINITY_DN19937_c1_g1~~TRINITY_DN19937_c1_g1_i4.p1  ORF type:complete len:198 (-),score=29.47 TRINITY_DN19937_c1_g1_i4:24-617(-)
MALPARINFLFVFLLQLLLIVQINCETALIDYYELANMDIAVLKKELKEAIASETSCKFDPTDQMITWNTLMIHNDLIQRNVTQLKTGTQTLTESSDPRIALVLQKHVHQMFGRMQCGIAVRKWDELFRQLFRNHELVDNFINMTDDGISYKRTSKDPYTVKLIKAHTDVVSAFTKLGRDAVRKGQPAPPGKQTKNN